MVARERKAEADAAAKLRYDDWAKPFSPISIGKPVRVQDPPKYGTRSARWWQLVKIFHIGSNLQEMVYCGATDSLFGR